MSTAAVNILEWTTEYAVVAEIDREHQILFGVLNRLHEAMLAGQGAEILEKLLAEVTQYTIFHFANEEKSIIRNSARTSNSMKSYGARPRRWGNASSVARLP
jgi:hemerythrin-like metal-binding protein